MQDRTKYLARRVRDALLARSPAALAKVIAQWLDDAEEHLQYLDWSDEFRFAVGYAVESDETGKIYDSFDLLRESEADAGYSWVTPEPEELFALIFEMPIEDFYHQIIAIAAEAYAGKDCARDWGSPPSSCSDGYAFMH